MPIETKARPIAFSAIAEQANAHEKQSPKFGTLADSHDSKGTVEILLVTRSRRVFNQVDAILRGRTWSLACAETPESARRLLRETPFSIVLCDAESGDDSWREVCSTFAGTECPPLVILTSNDVRHWAEALSLGAYDVLATPLDHSEVMHVLVSAWRVVQHRRLAKSVDVRENR
jgi:DNA-binding response OmpR family regulator